MTEIEENLEDTEVQYILDESQLVFDPSGVKSELSDIVFSDGGTTYLVEGDSNEDTYLWQDEDLNYYVKDENGQLQLVSTDQITDECDPLDSSESVQCNDEITELSENSEVLYVNEISFAALQQENLSNYQIAEIEDNAAYLQPVKLENDLNLDTISEIQYAVLRDGQLHIESYEPSEITFVNDETNQESVLEENTSQIVDLTKITGKNLITGQQVSLDAYIEKLQKKNGTIESLNAKNNRVTSKRKNECSLDNLVNKKLMLGKTDNGKILVGKITSVTKKTNEDIEENHQMNTDQTQNNFINLSNADATEDPLSASENPQNRPKPILIHERIVSRECFNDIEKTLSGLMNMATIKQKLQQKTIVVKVVEKRYEKPKEYTKKISFCSGVMVEEYFINESNEVTENWRFVLERNMKEAIFGIQNDAGVEENEDQLRNNDKVNVTIMMTYEKTGERQIQVILNPKTTRECLFCGKEFKTGLQLRVHQKFAHLYELYECKICGKRFNNELFFSQHKLTHANAAKAHDCTECNKSFLSAARLRRHMNIHFPKVAEGTSNEKTLHGCEICDRTFPTQQQLDEHKSTHSMFKYFVCETCGRKFSRHSNLLRHIEIHQGTDAPYKCSSCGCSYHYASTLTRHIVQNHMPIAAKSNEETPSEAN